MFDERGGRGGGTLEGRGSVCDLRAGTNYIPVRRNGNVKTERGVSSVVGNINPSASTIGAPRPRVRKWPLFHIGSAQEQQGETGFGVS